MFPLTPPHLFPQLRNCCIDPAVTQGQCAYNVLLRAPHYHGKKTRGWETSRGREGRESPRDGWRERKRARAFSHSHTHTHMHIQTHICVHHTHIHDWLHNTANRSLLSLSLSLCIDVCKIMCFLVFYQPWDCATVNPIPCFHTHAHKPMHTIVHTPHLTHAQTCTYKISRSFFLIFKVEFSPVSLTLYLSICQSLFLLSLSPYNSTPPFSIPLSSSWNPLSLSSYDKYYTYMLLFVLSRSISPSLPLSFFQLSHICEMCAFVCSCVCLRVGV